MLELPYSHVSLALIYSLTQKNLCHRQRCGWVKKEKALFDGGESVELLKRHLLTPSTFLGGGRHLRRRSRCLAGIDNQAVEAKSNRSQVGGLGLLLSARW